MCRRLQSLRRLLANGAIFCSPFLPLAHGLVLELSASVLAIIRRCLQTGRRAHTPCRWVLQTRRRQTLLRSGFPEQFRSEEHTSELQSLMRISYAVFCLKKKNDKTQIENN